MRAQISRSLVAISAVAVAAACGPAAPPARGAVPEGATFSLLDSFGTDGPGRLAPFPRDVAVDSDGSVWVADAANRRLVKFTSSGEFVTAIGAPVVTNPWGIGADSAGVVYVANREPNRVVRLRNDGTPLGTFADGPRLIGAPSDVAVGPDGTVYVTDGRVERFRPDGTRLAPVADVAAQGQIAVDASGAVLTVDGSRVARHPVRGPGFAAAFKDPLGGVAVDRRGDFYVGRGVGAEVLRFTPPGRLAEGIGGTVLGNVTGVAVDCRRNLYAARTYVGGGGNVAAVARLGDPAAAPPPCAAPAPSGSGYEVQADDVEVTQGVQYDDAFQQARTAQGFQTPVPAYGTARHRRAVGLAVGKTTVVRVYASLRSGPRAGVPNVPATLTVSRRSPDGSSYRALGTLTPIAAPPLLAAGSGLVDRARRSDPAGAYTFVLPPDWAAGTVSMEARVNPAHLGCPTDACDRRGSFVLGDVPFSPVATVPIVPLGLYDGRSPTVLPDPGAAFDTARAVLPLALDVAPYRGFLDAGADINAGSETVESESCVLLVFCSTTSSERPLTNEDRAARLVAKVEAWTASLGEGAESRVALGILATRTSSLLRSMAHGNWRTGPAPAGIVVNRRPLRTITHELTHALGYPHASSACDAKDGESWPPDERGLLGSAVGIDTRAGSGGGRGPFRIVAAGARRQPAEYFDYMSYCGGGSDADVWISPRQWQRMLRLHAPAGGPPPPADPPAHAAAAGARRDGLAVQAVVLGGGTTIITRVRPASLDAIRRQSRGAAPGLYVLTARTAAGDEVASVPMRAVRVSDGAGTVLQGGVPAAGVGAIRVGIPGAPATIRVKSRHAPRVRIVAPRSGARLRGATTEIRWTTADADAGSRLTADVEYSADGGRSWRPLAVEAAGRRLRVPTGLLSASRAARIRVRVSDGFNEAAAVSGRFTAPGGPPVPRILFPGPGTRLRADGTLVLAGEAWSADGRRKLDGRSLRWSLGGRRIGAGASARVTGLRPGRQTITLAVRDRGREARRRVTVRVQAVRPAFVLLRLPARLPRGARTAALRVATNAPATLAVGARRFAVGRAARTVRVPVPTGAGAARLVLGLRAGRLRSTATVTVPR